MKYVCELTNKKSLRVSNHLVEEYRKLVTIESPSDENLNKIDGILELAIYDDELNDLINKIDQEIAHNLVSVSTVLESDIADASKALSEAKCDFLCQCHDCVMHDTSQTNQETYVLSEKKIIIR